MVSAKGDSSSRRLADLATVFPYLRVLSAQYFRVEKAVLLARSSLWVGLPSDFNTLAGKEGDVFRDEGVIEGVEVEGGKRLLGVLRSVRRTRRHCRRQRRAALDAPPSSSGHVMFPRRDSARGTASKGD